MTILLNLLQWNFSFLMNLRKGNKYTIDSQTSVMILRNCDRIVAVLNV